MRQFNTSLLEFKYSCSERIDNKIEISHIYVVLNMGTAEVGVTMVTVLTELKNGARSRAFV